MAMVSNSQQTTHVKKTWEKKKKLISLRLARRGPERISQWSQTSEELPWTTHLDCLRPWRLRSHRSRWPVEVPTRGWREVPNPRDSLSWYPRNGNILGGKWGLKEVKIMKLWVDPIFRQTHYVSHYGDRFEGMYHGQATWDWWGMVVHATMGILTLGIWIPVDGLMTILQYEQFALVWQELPESGGLSLPKDRYTSKWIDIKHHKMILMGCYPRNLWKLGKLNAWLSQKSSRPLMPVQATGTWNQEPQWSHETLTLQWCPATGFGCDFYHFLPRREAPGSQRFAMIFRGWGSSWRRDGAIHISGMESNNKSGASRVDISIASPKCYSLDLGWWTSSAASTRKWTSLSH